MPATRKILVLEDQETDFKLEIRMLRQAGLDCAAQRVDNRAAFITALRDFEPDVVIVDYQVPGFDGIEAARIAKAYRSGLPVLLATGALADADAVDAFRAGITDYVLKDRLARLPAAISRALSEAEWLRLRQRIEADRDMLIRIMETSSTGLIGANIAGEIVAWNASAARFYGCARSDALGRPVREVLAAAYTDVLDVALRSVIDEGAAVSIEQQLPRSGGSDMVVSLSVAPARDAAERLIGVSILVRDITEQKRVERQIREARDQAEQANQAKSRFLALITHELRTPLHGILGYAELLLLEGGLTKPQSERLEAMMAAGQYLLGTINAVLDMSQIEAERLELSPSIIELRELIETCLDVVRPGADAKGLALSITPAGPLRLFTDASRLRQILLNLLGNAVKFTPSGTVRVRYRASHGGTRVRVEVADTGPGVWSRHHDKLFQAFERLNVNAVSGIEGAGLGLALTAKLVKLMGGQIGYDDNAGGGSVFWFELPCGDVAADTGTVAAPRQSEGPPALYVLVVDDDPVNRSIATRFLSMGGHSVAAVESGAAAVEAAGAQAFDVILMDVRMPGMNGLEATRQIRALPSPYCDVPVLAVTAHAFAEQVLACEHAGMNGHVAKPFNQATLLAAVADGAKALKCWHSAAADVGSKADSAIFDRAIFAEVCDALPPGAWRASLRTLIARGETLLAELRDPAMRSQSSALAAAAHKLAGGAGTLGFLSMAAAARAFEFAADGGAVDTDAFAGRLAGIIAESLATARNKLDGEGVTPDTAGSPPT